MEIVVYYLLIGRMTCLGCWDEFPMVSTLVNVIHWTRPTVNHHVTLSVVINYYITWTLNLERILRLC